MLENFFFFFDKVFSLSLRCYDFRRIPRAVAKLFLETFSAFK